MEISNDQMMKLKRSKQIAQEFCSRQKTNREMPLTTEEIKIVSILCNDARERGKFASERAEKIVVDGKNGRYLKVLRH